MHGMHVSCRSCTCSWSSGVVALCCTSCFFAKASICMSQAPCACADNESVARGGGTPMGGREEYRCSQEAGHVQATYSVAAAARSSGAHHSRQFLQLLSAGFHGHIDGKWPHAAVAFAIALQRTGSAMGAVVHSWVVCLPLCASSACNRRRRSSRMCSS